MSVGSGLEFKELPLVTVDLRILFQEFQSSFGMAGASRIERWARTHNYAFVVRNVREHLENSAPLSNEQLPFGGILLEDPAAAIVAIVQHDHIRVSWFLGAGDKPASYPRYSSLRELLRSLMDEFIGENQSPPNVSIANICYSNFLSGQSFREDLLSIFTPGFFPPSFNNASEVHQQLSRWRESTGLDRSINLQQADLTKGPTLDSARGYLLKTVSGIVLSRGDSWEQAIDRCHDDAQSFFLELVSDEAKLKWGYSK